MTLANLTTQKKLNLRLTLVCAVAVSVGLSMAWVSIGKFALFVFGLSILIWRYFIATDKTEDKHSKPPKNTSRAILLVLTIFAISLFWTTADMSESVGSLAKYGKLMTILLLPLLLKSRQEVIYALTAFVAAQVFLVSSSWALFWGLPVPWATSKIVSYYAVFSTYLDQGLMGATTAAICWHLRALAPGRFGKYFAVLMVLVFLANVLFVLIGRSGHVVSIVLLSLAVMWQLPIRHRWTVPVIPIVLLLFFYSVSPKVQNRTDMVKKEIQSFSLEKGESLTSGTSSGVRLQLWSRAIKSISENPVVGSGIGSWSNEYNRIETQLNPQGEMVGERGNPHQEYLHWGVQLGLPGLALLLFLFVSIFQDSKAGDVAVARATQSVVAALAVSCLFNSSIYDALIGDFFCVALGLLLALSGYKTPAVSPLIAVAKNSSIK